LQFKKEKAITACPVKQVIMRENKLMQEFSCMADRGYKETNKLSYSSPNSRK
jgi:hypothetical protein